MIYVPAVRDTVNIAALIASTKFVDKEYDATQIGDDVQMVEVEEVSLSRMATLHLDRRSTAERRRQSPRNDPFAPKIISQAGSEPKVDPEASPSPSPEASASPEASPARRLQRRRRAQR